MTSWIDLVGYQHEAVHDAAITALLTGSCGPAVASALAGRPVDTVRAVERQRRVGGAVADVVTTVAAGNMSRVLAIETKVDSQASRSQMDRTARDGDQVVMLAAGTAAMRACTIAPAWEGDPEWRIVDVSTWSEALCRLGPLEPLLDDYRNAVAREAREQQRARELARAAHSDPAFTPRIPAEELVGWAWLDETWHALHDRQPPGRFNAHKDISGPIFFWEDSWKDFGSMPGGVYLDLMVEGTQHLIVLKGADVPAADRADLLDCIADRRPPGAVVPRCRSSRGSTFRVLIWDATHFDPHASAQLAWDVHDFAAHLTAEL